MAKAEIKTFKLNAEIFNEIHLIWSFPIYTFSYLLDEWFMGNDTESDFIN